MTNQEPKVYENYEFDYGIIVSNEGDNDVLITIPNSIEILLVDFDTSKTVSVPATDENFTSITVSYPLDELPVNYEGLTLEDLLKYPNTLLTVVITSEKLTEVIRTHSTLWVGTNLSMMLPNFFAENLAHFLTTGELPNE